MFPDMQKMFDPSQTSQFMQNIQKMWDSSAVDQQVETCKKLSSIWSETFSTCYEQQMKMAQEAMQNSVECMKELSSSKGIEEMMSKQAEWSKKCSESCQTNAQNIAKTMQKGYQQASETITKAMSNGAKTVKTA